MRKYLSNFQFSLIILTTVFGFVASTVADDPDKTPTAISVLKKFADAAGGAAKFKAIKSLKMTGNVSIAAAGVEGTVEVIQVNPNKIASKAEMPQIGSQSQGCNGEVAWELSTMMGPRILDEKEMSRLQDQADFQKFYDPEGYYKKMDVAGIEEMNGEKAFKLKLTNKNDVESTEYFSVKSGLQVAAESTMPTQMGDIEIKSLIGDYKQVEGVQMPHKIESQFPNGMSQVVTFSKIEVNPAIDSKAFDVPDEIKSLLEETKGESEKESDEGSGDK